MPTSEWKAATSCGMAVMAIRRAMKAPAEPPISTPARIMPTVTPSSAWRDQRFSTVTVTAMAMPIMPSALPRRLVSGFDSPRSAWMNRTPEIR